MSARYFFCGLCCATALIVYKFRNRLQIEIEWEGGAEVPNGHNPFTPFRINLAAFGTHLLSSETAQEVLRKFKGPVPVVHFDFSGVESVSQEFLAELDGQNYFMNFGVHNANEDIIEEIQEHFGKPTS